MLNASPEPNPNSTTLSKRGKYSPAQRRKYVKQWLESGENKRGFCRRHGIAKSSFYKWIAQYDLKAKPTQPKGITWQPVACAKPIPTPKASVFFELHLSSGHYFRLPQKIDLVWLKQLLSEVV